MTKRDGFAEGLERRARRAIFWHALLRWESAVVIALSLVISAFLGLLGLVGLFPMGWTFAALGIGFLIEAVIFVSSITDEEENARVVAALLRDQYKPRQLQSLKLRGQLDKALEYQGLIARTVRLTRKGVLQDRLARATMSVGDWIEAIYRLASRLDAYERNQVIKQDLRSVPMAIENFKKRLSDEDDLTVQATLRNTIADKQRQWEHLSHLQNTMEKAEYQLESTLAALGTVYAQLQTIDLRGAEKGHADRLREEIDEQVSQLQDLSQAMDEVYQAR
ncbi:MAG: hypothetical protein JSV81_12800 [Anaerolineales bacterium]|nr:MAG: hypothetical protein JSV81_12800 [Anaerolineales bacterium]